MRNVFAALKGRGIAKATPQYRLSDVLIGFLKSKFRLSDDDKKPVQRTAKEGATLQNKDATVGAIATVNTVATTTATAMTIATVQCFN